MQILSKRKRGKKPHDRYSDELSAVCSLALFSSSFFSSSSSLSSLHHTYTRTPIQDDSSSQKKEKKNLSVCVCVYTQAYALSFVVMVRIYTRIERREKK
jgi:hypothetical protein